MQTVTLALLPDGSAGVVLPHGRRGEPAIYRVAFGPGGQVLLTSPEGAVYTVERRRGLWQCSCPSWRYSDPGYKSCKHLDGAVLSRWLDAVAGAIES
jgi:hypothetical protein